MSDIFISYSNEDRDFAEKLVAALEKQQPNWSIWWDREIAPGRKFADVIDDELKQARCVIVVWSTSSVDSDWVQAEAEKGRTRGILIPISIDKADFPLPFDRIQTVSLERWNGRSGHAGFRLLVQSIANVLDTEVSLPPAATGLWAKLTGGKLGARHTAAALVGLMLLGSGSYFALQELGLLDPTPDGMVQNPTPDGMVQIPGGAFLMGSTRDEAETAYTLARQTMPELPKSWMWPERPEHEVFLDPFYIDIHEVTVGQYQRYLRLGNTGLSDTDSSGADRYPQVGVTWREADAYCRRFGKYLPSEAQWEMAARSGQRTIYPWGNDPVGGSRVNYCDVNCPSDRKDTNQDDGQRLRAPVGSYPEGASAQGVHDLAGNVAEWIRDWYDADFYVGRESSDEVDREKNPINKKESAEKLKAVRGGHYLSGPAEIRAAYRSGLDAGAKKEFIGFRCVKSAS